MKLLSVTHAKFISRKDICNHDPVRYKILSEVNSFIFLAPGKMVRKDSKVKDSMFDTGSVIILWFSIVETLIIVVGNIFTVYVFWKHRTRLKRTSFLLINLAVAVLLVGLIETLAIATSEIPLQPKKQELVKSVTYKSILSAFQTTSAFASVFFLALISLERGYALIWPLRHRVASTKSYICSTIFVWVAAIAIASSFSLLYIYRLVDYLHWTVAYCSIILLCLLIISASYLTIRKRLNRRVPVLDMVHNRQNGAEQNAKLSKTLFIVIAASLVCWIPAVVVYCTHFLCSKCLPYSLVHMTTTFRLANSLINPIIYSLKMPVFRKTLTRMKICKESKRYRVN